MRELASLLNNMFPHSNVDHNDMFPIAATRWQVLKEVRFDLTRAGAEILWQHTHAGAQGTLKCGSAQLTHTRIRKERGLNPL